MKKLSIALLMVIAASVSYAAGKAGSCESAAAAISVGQSKTVTLVAEYDPDEKTYDSDMPVYYLAVTLSRGYAYTLTYSGASADYLDVYAYPRTSTEAENDREIYEPSASFSDEGEFSGVYVQYLQADEWWDDDPASWKYYIQVSGGAVGDKVTVSIVSGIVPFATPGTADNPTVLAFTDKGSSASYSYVEGEYYFKANLKAGRFYRMFTTSGTADAPVMLDIGGSSVDYDIIDDADHKGDENNTAFIIAPAGNGVFTFKASGTSAAFNLTWNSIPMRAITAHPFVTLDESNNFSATFLPGRRISSYNYADDIIDEGLCRISLSKGERWVFMTEGAMADCEMVLYNSKGDILATNQTVGNGSLDTLIGYEATAAGYYYVGVCERDLGVTDEPTGSDIILLATRVSATDGDPDEWDSSDDKPAGATGLSPQPAVDSIDPIAAGTPHGTHRLGLTDWVDCYQLGVRKGLTYILAAEQTGAETTDLTLKAEVFTLSGTTERAVKNVTGGIDPTDEGYLEFTADANATYYIRVSVAEGKGLVHPGYTLYSLATSENSEKLGILTVNTPGASTATWSLGSESVKYPSGASVLVSGTQTIKFSTVNGFKAEVSSKTVTVEPGTEPTVVNVKYSDTFDPKDDAPSGKSGKVSYAATSITLKNVDTEYAKRTLWEDDPCDTFAIQGADGYLYDIALRDVEGDSVVFSITNAQLGVMVENVTSVSQLALPKTTAKYILTVENGDDATTFGGYTLAGKYANVGAIKFASTKVSSKENAASVKLTVNRTAKDGYVRVMYGTVAGTAKPGVDYIAQSGTLEWPNGDNKQKTIEIKLIPDLVPEYEGDKTFSVMLKPIEEVDRIATEYPAMITGGDTCVVTLTDTSRPGETAATAYAKKAPKVATVRTETVPLESGTFYGVLAEDGASLTNGLPQFASVTLTASTAKPAAISAKVGLAGKTYTFSAKGWDEDESDDTVKVRTMTLVQKLSRIDEETKKTVSDSVTNTLKIAVNAGRTDSEGDWLNSIAYAELVMNVPDANNKGYQADIMYGGMLYRQNAKIQDYLTVVTNFTGYYTVALAPNGVSAYDAPAGNGYLTLTVDNKGTVKIAGMLADGTTKPSLSVTAAPIAVDVSSGNGYSMYVPVYLAKAPMLLAGTLRLYADESGAVVVDPAMPLTWNNDNALLTYYGESGYSLAVEPVGGWYDTIVNLQAYYLTRAFEVSTPDVSEFFTEVLTSNTATKDYHFTEEAQPNGFPVDLSGDVFSTAKKALVKSGTIYDLAASVNPCNVQVKLARATGVLQGSFSLWSESPDGSKQKEITGFKHFGVLVMNRSEDASLDPDVVTAGFCTQSVKVSDYNESTKRTTTRTITASLPFNLLGVDQGEPDWYADDWGDVD